MKRVQVLHATPDLTATGGGVLRFVGMLDDNRSLAIATMPAARPQDYQAKAELQFELGEAVRLAQACLAGDRRALTTPGLARVLAGTVLALAKIAESGQALERADG